MLLRRNELRPCHAQIGIHYQGYDALDERADDTDRGARAPELDYSQLLWLGNLSFYEIPPKVCLRMVLTPGS